MSAVIAAHEEENRNQMQMSSSRSHRQRAVGRGERNSRSRDTPQQRCIMLLALVLLIVPDLIVALRDVSVTIPQAVKRGSNAMLTCNYDMENDTLYSVKWYKGRREFYRYTPKENPAMKVFPMTSGLNVERNFSNQSHVVLQSVALNISGKFTCEISVEAPSFQTAMVSGEMEVVELPEEHTTVTGIQARYRIGDLVDGNCSIKYSKPAANLTWTINGIVVPPHHIKTYQIEKHENSSLESVMSVVHFMVTTQHFLKGQMRLKCTASLFDIFKEEIESIIEEDRPRIMASGRSYDMNNYPFDQHSSGDGFEDHNESYLTYYSPNAGSAAARPAEIFWQPLLRQLHGYMQWVRCSMQSVTRLLKGSQADAAINNNDRNKIAELRISCNKFDVWQLSIYAAVAALWLTTTTHQIMKCQHKGFLGNGKAQFDNAADNDNDNDNAAADFNTNSNASSDVLLDVLLSKAKPFSTSSSSSSSSISVSKSSNVGNDGNSGKCFYNCQMATLSLVEKRCCCCPFVEQQQQKQQEDAEEQLERELCRRHQRHHRSTGNQTDGSIESANDLTASTCQQLSAALANVTVTVTATATAAMASKETTPEEAAATTDAHAVAMAVATQHDDRQSFAKFTQSEWPEAQADQRLLMTALLQLPACSSC